LCGFAHVASMAIFCRRDCALVQANKPGRVAWRALIAANLACLMTACIAGDVYRQ